MIDPTNTEPIPVHKPHPRRVLSVLALLVLFLVAVTLVLQKTDFSPSVPDVSVVQPPQGEPLFSEEDQTTFAEIMKRVTEGEISREEGERRVNELLSGADAS